LPVTGYRKTGNRQLNNGAFLAVSDYQSNP
jgi:hypothetical protein